MGIWIGNAGAIRLRRKWESDVYDHIDRDSCNLGLRRFGFDDGITGIITGDKVTFKRVDEDGRPVQEPLDFVDATAWHDGKQHNDGSWFCHCDSVGGVRLYEHWEDALRNDVSKAHVLNKPSERYRVSYKLVNGDENCLAQTTSWTLNTNRDTVDVSGLGDQFTKQFSTMISGSGTISCLFDFEYHASKCSGAVSYDLELPVYMHKLAVRQEVGSTFTGVFIMRQSNALPIEGIIEPRDMERELFYLCDCVVTNVATELSPSELIRSTIDFVTTGEVQLLYGLPSHYLLQEQNDDKVLQESDFGILLSAPDYD